MTTPQPSSEEGKEAEEERPKQETINKLKATDTELKLRFKNVCIKVLADVRQRRRLPTLLDFIKFYQSKAHEPNAKENFRNNFKYIYGDV